MSKLDESPIERVLRVCSEHTIISDAEGDAALAELAALRSELEDWRNSARMASGEMCGDEKHCTCVPLLRNRIAKLEAALAKADEMESATFAQMSSAMFAYRTAREAAK